MTEYELKIPIKNIYYMLSYAFGVLRQNGFAELDSETFENIYDLLSEILIKGIENQVKRGIYKEYIYREEPLSVLRGKISMEESIKLKSESSNKLYCIFDEFSSDNILNEILKSTCFALIRKEDLKDVNKKNLKRLMMYFGDVRIIPLRHINWTKIRYCRNNITYKMLINICYLICEGLIVNEEKGTYKFAEYIKDEKMATLYEKFVCEFYKKECPDIEVNYQQQINWKSDDGYIDLLPKMRTDISLTRGGHRLIIDTKFYAENMQSGYMSEKSSFISGNLYQIFAYVKNSNYCGRVSGMLLYPAVEYSLSQDYKLSGNNIYIRTVDLSRDFSDIKKCLMDIAGMV